MLYVYRYQHICTLDVATACFSLTLTFCSLFHLALVAWERYVAIRKWRDYRDLLTKSRLKKLAAIAWISGPVFVLSPFLISLAVSGRTIVVVFLVSTCFILALIVYFYVMVYLEIRKRKFNQILQVSVLKNRIQSCEDHCFGYGNLVSFIRSCCFSPFIGNIFPRTS